MKQLNKENLNKPELGAKEFNERWQKELHYIQNNLLLTLKNYE